MNSEKSPFCKMEYLIDQNGQEVLLKEGQFQVMMEWEKPYMEACIDVLNPFGDVLEIGFGCGYSASRIQTYRPASHTIIEYHPLIAAQARKWAKNHSHVKIIEDTWQNALPNLGRFDCIFFDDYPLQSPEETQALQRNRDAASLIVEAGKRKMSEMANEVPFLESLKYTDEDLNFFFSQLEEEQKTTEKHFLPFFFGLAQKKQISDQQLQQALNRLKQEKWVSTEEIAAYEKTHLSQTASPLNIATPGDRLFEFLESCLKHHMKAGSRFSCFLSDPTSKFEDEKFFNKVITNPFLDYREETIAIEVPEHCGYYTGDKALVILITKL